MCGLFLAKFTRELAIREKFNTLKTDLKILMNDRMKPTEHMLNETHWNTCCNRS